MANSKTEKAKTAKVKKERAPKEYLVPLHNRGDLSIKQSVQHVRGTGVLVTTTQLDGKGNAVGVSTTWIPGLKPKSKNGERFLVVDKGPKPKKEKKAKK